MKDMTTNRSKAKGRVIPFSQNAAFYMKRGAKNMERNDLVQALGHYRQAYMRSPDDPEPCIAMAEILSRMQRFEESNRMLLLLVSADETVSECYFGLACNYFGMREYDCAAECLETYLDMEPNGPFAAEAEDFLDFLNDDDAMYEMTGLRSDADYDDNASCLFARHLIEAGDYADAVAELSRQASLSPDCRQVKNQLAVAYLCNNEKARAEELIQAILAEYPEDVQARCNYALLLHDRGDDEKALEQMRIVEGSATDAAEQLQNISVLQMELKEYDKAEATLNRMRALLPYDETVMHRLACCRYLQGDAEGAAQYYKRLLRINPDDTVASYYLAQCRRKDASPQTARSRWMPVYQVPFGEAFRRLNQINKALSDAEPSMQARWREDAHLRGLVKWALTLPDLRVKKSMLTLLYTFGDAYAERMLREFLLQTDQPDSIKHGVLGILKHIGAPEPYAAYINGRWLQVRVSMLEFPYPLPRAYENVAQLLLSYMLGTCDEVCLVITAGIFHRYVDSLNPKFPRMSAMQELAMAAALEYLGCIHGGLNVTEEELCAKYRVTPARLKNALAKLEPFIKEPV